MSDQSSQNSAPKGNEGSFLSNLVSGATPGTRGIEAAYNRAGAGDHHTPGYAGTLGSKNATPTSGGSESNEQPSMIGNMVNSVMTSTKLGGTDDSDSTKG